VGLFFQGAGLTLLQTASNPYITILGPIESAAKRMCMMGVCNGVAGILAPDKGGAVLLCNEDEITEQVVTLRDGAQRVVLDGLARKVIVPYLIITGVLVLLSVLIQRSGLPEIDEEAKEEEEHDPEFIAVEKKSVFHYPHLLLGVLTLFVYTGVEVIAAN